MPREAERRLLQGDGDEQMEKVPAPNFGVPPHPLEKETREKEKELGQVHAKNNRRANTKMDQEEHQKCKIMTYQKDEQNGERTSRM